VDGGENYSDGRRAASCGCMAAPQTCQWAARASLYVQAWPVLPTMLNGGRACDDSVDECDMRECGAV